MLDRRDMPPYTAHFLVGGVTYEQPITIQRVGLKLVNRIPDVMVQYI